ncbi:MAG: ABC transporter substrate-binding protein [archaeon]
MKNDCSKKIFIISIIIVFILVILLLGKITGLLTLAKPIDNTIKIGFVGPLTGDYSSLGIGAKNSIILAKNNLNNTNYNYEVIFEDDKVDPTITATVSEKFKNQDKVDAVISMFSGPGQILSNNSANFVHIGLTTDPNVSKGKNNFTNWIIPSKEVKAYLDELKLRNYNNLCVIIANQAGVKEIYKELERQLSNYNTKIVCKYEINSGDKDFRLIITKSKEKNPNVYLLLLLSPELEIFTKQYKELGLSLPLTAIEAFEFSSQQSLFEGYWYINAKDPIESFSKEYQDNYGTSPPMASSNAYDSFNLIVYAYEKAGGKYNYKIKPTTKEVSDILENLKNYNGASGDLSALDDGMITSNAVVKEIRNGKPVTLVR